MAPPALGLESPPTPELVCPLRELLELRKFMRPPFSLQELSQIEKRLGSFSASSDNYIKEFQYLAQV